MTQDWFLKCKIGAGVFGSERSIVLRFNEHEETALVDVDHVLPQQLIPGPGVIDGWVRIHLIESKGNKALVDLPGDSFGSGMRMIVPKNLLKERVKIA